jgi:hypothetical protein
MNPIALLGHPDVVVKKKIDEGTVKKLMALFCSLARSLRVAL